MNILLLGNSAFIEESVRNLSYNYKICGVSYSVEEAKILIDELSPDTIIIDADIRGGGISVGSEIRKAYKNVKIFIASDYISIDMLQRAVANGLTGVVKKPITSAQLAETLQKIEKYGIEYITKYSEDIQKEVIVFYSPKGGVGKTTLAVNTAGLISNTNKKLKVVLIDFDIWANVEIMLQIKSRYTISDIYSLLSGTMESEGEIEEYIYKHPAGFHIIPGIRKVTESNIYTAEFVARLIDTLKNIYDIIIVDTNSLL
ncbi:MAG: AAA family ATPase, partial [Caldanaerobacter sp.]